MSASPANASPAVPTQPYVAPVDPPFTVTLPKGTRSGLVVSSPHSGDRYPEVFRRMSRLDPLTLRRSEDAFVNELMAAAPGLGAPLIEALFPRAYCDLNREAYELDPAMFSDPLPDYVTTDSSKLKSGLGTVAKVVVGGLEIYPAKLPFAEAAMRIETLWRPYHAELRALLDQTRQAAGVALLLDCHSMPSIAGPNMPDNGQRRPDMVLGDFHGTSCSPRLVDRVEAYLQERGYSVARNKPYAGGYITQHYTNRPAGFQTLQIEINRDLYMDEAVIIRSAGFGRVQAAMAGLVELLVGSAVPEFLDG